jgi:hypothetical protein
MEKVDVISGIIMIRDVMRSSLQGWIERKKGRGQRKEKLPCFLCNEALGKGLKMCAC